MQEARNVVEFTQSRRPNGLVGNRVLDECGELAANHLVEAVREATSAARTELHQLAANSRLHEMSMLYLEAMEFLRDHAKAIEVGFRQLFFQGFKQSCRKWLLRPSPTQTPETPLSLLEPDALEESLAVNNLANAIHNGCGEELFGLNQRVGLLLNQHDLSAEDNPLGPEVISQALLDTCKNQGDRLKVRLVLVSTLGKHLPERVKAVYQTLNRFLADKGVLPSIRVGLRKSQTPGEAAGSTAPAQAGATPSADLLGVLQQLLGGMAHGSGNVLPQDPAMTGGRSGSPAHGIAPMGAAAPGQPAATATSRQMAVGPAPIVVQTLTQLQRGHIEGLNLQGMDASRLTDGQVNVLRELKNSAVTAGMDQLDIMTLDIVALIFDYILDDHRVPDAMKALIGRLQIPVLKIAMLDRAFFSQKAHPARRLLDALAEVSMGWDPQEGHDSGLYRKVDESVQRILNEFDDKLDVFIAVLEDLERYLAEEKRQIDVLTSRGAQILYTREQREVASIVAHDTIHTQLFSHTVPALIEDFLYGPWKELLTLIYSQSGEGSEAWKGAVQTIADLVWSVAPKATAEERRLLVQRLPNLLKRLADGLKAIEHPQSEQDRFFAALVKCHAEAVKNGMHGIAPDAAPAEERAAAPPPPPAAEPPADFEEIPVQTAAVEVDPKLMQEVSALPAVSPHVLTEEITVTDVSWLAGGEPEGDPYDAKVRQLKRGSWIEIRQEDGSFARVKLAWISPMRGLYLFTNRLGQRAMSIHANGLAAKLRSGEIQLLDSVPLMDRAVDALLTRLQNTA